MRDLLKDKERLKDRIDKKIEDVIGSNKSNPSLSI